MMLDFFHWTYGQHWMLDKMNVANVYFITTGYLPQMINICWCRKYSLNYMLANPDFNNNLIDNYKQERFPTFMFVLWLCVFRCFFAKIQCYLSTKRRQFHKKNPGDIANIYVSIFNKYLQFWSLLYILMIHPTWYFTFSSIFFNINMIKISDIYVSTNWYILYKLNICWCRENSEHSMSANTDFNNISVENPKWKILPTFMLADGVYVAYSLNLVYMEIIASIKCYFLQGKKVLH